MKVQVTLSLAALATIFLFSGCQKAFDYLKDHPGENAQLCQVQKLELGFSPGVTQEISITYNAAGNPVNTVITGNGFPSGEEYHFRYDKYARLSDYFFTYYGGTGAVVWHEYHYPDKKTIIDSVFEYTGNVNDPDHPHNYAANGILVNLYSLDASGRIVKNTQSLAHLDDISVINYTYDAHGNLVRPGITYDNKINVYQTNKVWMLVFNDYSINNPLGDPNLTQDAVSIPSYNAEGLPLRINSLTHGTSLFGYSFVTNLQLVYNCDLSKAPAGW